MANITKNNFISVIESMIIKANFYLTPEVKQELQEKMLKDTSPVGKQVLKDIIENSEIAEKQKKPLCQDSGVCVFFVKIGYKLKLSFNITKAINKAVASAHKKAYLRSSMVNDPFNRVNPGDNTPAVIHYSFDDTDNLTVEFSAKGAGSENMSTMKIFRPTDSIETIKQYIIDVIFNSGGRPCPPITVGIGIGGNFETCAILAKKALFVPLKKHNENPLYKKMEIDLYNKINDLGIGAMGLGGKTTCIGVKIINSPCHIASLPVAININCHSSRHMKVIF